MKRLDSWRDKSSSDAAGCKRCLSFRSFTFQTVFQKVSAELI